MHCVFESVLTHLSPFLNAISELIFKRCSKSKCTRIYGKFKYNSITLLYSSCCTLLFLLTLYVMFLNVCVLTCNKGGTFKMNSSI